MVLAFILKSAFPGVTILQFGARNDFRHALREWNDVARWHSKKINGDRINLPTRENANLQALNFSQALRGRRSRRSLSDMSTLRRGNGFGHAGNKPNHERNSEPSCQSLQQ